MLVAVAHDVEMFLVAVAHRDEIGQQPVGLVDREVTQVFAHDRDQNHRRQGQESLFERSEQGRRPLHQVGHFVQQGRVVGDRTLHRASQRRHSGSDVLTPAFAAEHDGRLFHGGTIVPGVANFDDRRAIGTQAVGQAAALCPGVTERNDGRAVQRQQPAQRAAVADVAAVPAHGLLELDSGYQTGQVLGQHLDRRATFLADNGRDVALT